jgi:hypothetical protein
LAEFYQDENKLNQIETQAISDFNNHYRSAFYKKYLAEQSYSNVDIIDEINQNIHNIKCLLPFSSSLRNPNQQSAIRLSIHYTI